MGQITQVNPEALNVASQMILKEIDLTGTDAERKATLDQFEKDWKALTGSDTLEGARFVGKSVVPDDGEPLVGVFSFSSSSYCEGMLYASAYTPYKAELTIDGSLTITPLFQHLEAITITTSNSDADKAANVAAIKAYVNNLKNLGVDVTKGYMIPVIMADANGFVTYSGDPTSTSGLGFTRTSKYSQATIIRSDGTAQGYLMLDAVTAYSSLTTTSKQIVGAINEVNALAKGVKALGAIELKAEDKAANKTALAAFLKILTDAGIDTSNGYSTPIRITGNSQEYFGTLNIGTGTLLSGVVTDINESHHYPCNVNITDGELTFSETNYFLEKTSNEVVEMLDAIKYSHTPVPFTETTLSNKAQLEVFLSKVPDAQVMHCTYKGVYAGTLHKINGDWYGMLVKNTNDYADNLNVKLQADGTLIEGTTSVQSINAQLDAINGEVK